MKSEPVSSVAVSVTVAFGRKRPLHVAPQLTPAGLEVTVPEPLPGLLTVRIMRVISKTASTFFAESIPKEQVMSVPVQSPSHRTKLQPVNGVAVRVTEVPCR